MSEAKNVDATLVQVINQQMSENNHTSTVQEAPVANVEVPLQAETPVVEEKVVEQEKPIAAAEPEKSESPIDEYGNPIEKPKMYSEDEVQRMLRDRLSRGRHAEQQPTHKEVVQATQDFKSDPNSEETWEDQLAKFVDQRLEKKQTEAAENAWRNQEIQKQTNFEEKFTNGMSKYPDFQQVVSNKPITDGMMLATRALDNPAAFLYSACKLHPQEIESIAKIPDVYAQAAAVGRLHERMIKNKVVTSAAPRPLETPKGDLPTKSSNQPSLEERINQYAKQKRK